MVPSKRPTMRFRSLPNIAAGLVLVVASAVPLVAQPLFPGDAVVSRQTTADQVVALEVVKAQSLGILLGTPGLASQPLALPKGRSILASEFGNNQVWAIAIDDGTGDIYAAVGPALYDPSSGPASPGIYRIPLNGSPVLWATLPGQWGIGGLCVDRRSCAIFASNLDDGSIFRISLLDPNDQSFFDPLLPDSGSPTMAPLGERILGLSRHPQDQRLTYSVWANDGINNGLQNSVRSVDLDASGAFLPATDRLEFSLPSLASGVTMPAGDLEWNPLGTSLLIGELGIDSGSGTRVDGQSRALRFDWNGAFWSLAPTFLGQLPAVPPNDPVTGAFAISTQSLGRRTSGGVAWGYQILLGVTPFADGSLVLALGTDLLVTATSTSRVDGIQVLPESGGNPSNGLSVDLDGITQIPDSRHGTVEIFRPWAAPVSQGFLGDRVWVDRNGDGIQSPGEPGLAGVTVDLIDHATSLVVQTVQTDSLGSYLFQTNPGIYRIRFLLPSGYAFTLPMQGGDPALASSADPSTGESGQLTVVGCDRNGNVDAGLQPLFAELGDFIFDDVNRDGIQTPGEIGIPGVTVRLLDAAGTQVLQSTTTISNGSYRIQADPGTYILELLAPPSYERTLAFVGQDPALDSDFDPITGRTPPFTVQAGEVHFDLDGGLSLIRAKLGNFVWDDQDRDGLQDPLEVGLAGVTVRLLDSSSGSLLQSVQTDSLGHYEFCIDAGTYTLEVLAPVGYAHAPHLVGSDLSIDSDIDPATGRSLPLSLAYAQTDTTRDAGLYLLDAEIGDRVWLDLDANGLQDPNESGIPGITVELWNLQGFSQSTTTNAQGIFSFATTPGTWQLRFLLPSGFAFTLPVQGTNPSLDSDADPITGFTTPVALLPGLTNNDIDAGLLPLLSSVGDRVWEDTNGDGLQSIGELGVAQVLVQLRDAATLDILQITVTDMQGNYTFAAPEGTYIIEWQLPGGYLFTPQHAGMDPTLDSDADPLTGRSAPFFAAWGSLRTDLDAGIRLADATIGDFVWQDQNGNGIQDIGEPGLPNALVQLYDATGAALLQSYLTTSTGQYSFTAPPGTYILSFGTPLFHSPSPVMVGNDPSLDSDPDPLTGRTQPISVTAGSHVNHVDAGFVPNQSTISGRTWLDINNNALQDPGEPGLGGVSLELRTVSGSGLLQTATTDAQGLYVFAAPPSNYRVYVQEPVGLLRVLAAQGTNPTLDSDFNPNTGLTSPLNLQAGQMLTNVDAGLAAGSLGIVGDYVWQDSNCNGLQEFGEPGLQGVQVQLFLQSQPQVPVQSTTTGAFGQFHFLAPADTYFLRFIPGQTLVGTAALVGTDPMVDSDMNPQTGATALFSLAAGGARVDLDAGFCLCTGVTAATGTLGAGCGIPSAPQLTVTPPILGGTMTMSLSHPIASSPYWLFASAPPVTPYVSPASGCAIYVDLLNPANFFTAFSGTLDQLGEWTIALPVPSDPLLAGVPVIFQAAVFGSGGPLAGFHLSNGVLITFGCP